MKRIATIVTLILACSARPAHTTTFTFDFEAETVGAYTSLTMLRSGVTATLTRTSGLPFNVSKTVVGQPPPWNFQDLENFGFPGPADAYNANFSQGLDFVSILFGDFGPSDDDSPVVLRAYSGVNGTGLLDTVFQSWTALDSFPDFHGLSFASATPILSVQFFGNGPIPNSLFWDNITCSVSVPEPATLTLFGLGILAAGCGRWRSRKLAPRRARRSRSPGATADPR